MPHNKKKKLALTHSKPQNTEVAFDPSADWLVRHSPANVTLSTRAFYSLYLVIGLGMTLLLHGAGLSMPVADITLPDFRAKQNAAITNLVSGYPIEAMLPDITGQSRLTSAFLVSIAKKESNWGKRVPRAADGSDCYNYWGYTGAGSRGIAMGHGCFASSEEAVAVVGRRIDNFARDYNIDTPEELIVWKCGWNCDGHSPQSVRKWVKDVAYYYDKVQN